MSTNTRRDGVETALRFAEIPESKLGSARRARLSRPEQDLYVWILRRFATVGRPSAEEARVEAARLGLDVEAASRQLAQEDLVHRSSDAEITVAYPFSGVSTAHRVRFPGGHEVHAMCAIDAFGIAPMFGEEVEITSLDPHTGEEIRVRIDPDGAADASPASTVVVSGVLESEGDSCCGCCPVLNFFGSNESARAWLGEHEHVRGTVISVDEASAAGRAVFGHVLNEP